MDANRDKCFCIKTMRIRVDRVQDLSNSAVSITDDFQHFTWCRLNSKGFKGSLF